jgi:hypothetical protein
MPDHYIRSVDDIVAGRKYTAYRQADASPRELLPSAPPERRLPAIETIAEEAVLWEWEQSESTDEVATYRLRRADNDEYIPVRPGLLNESLWIVEGWEAHDE